jgi:hypothetical protein
MSITEAVNMTTGARTKLITCHANRGKKYRVQADEHGNFLSVEVRVSIGQPVDCWRTIWRTDGGKDPSTTACCAMRSARRVLDSATAK